MASPSQESTASESSAPDQCPVDCKINVSTPAVLVWETGQLSDLILDIYFDPSDKTAFFKFRNTVFLKSLKANIYLFVAPQRIQSLVLDESLEPKFKPSGDAQKSTSRWTSLHLTLNEAADLVGPAFTGLTPKNRSFGRTLDQLREAAETQRFCLYISHKSLSEAQLLSLCNAVSQPIWRSTSGQDDLKCLYHGKGGRVICGGKAFDLLSCLPQPVVDSPPSYDEAGPSPPIAGPSQPPNKKRRLENTEAIMPDTGVMVAMEAMCRKLMQQQKAELRSSIVSEMKQYVNEQVRELETRMAQQIEMEVELYGDRVQDHLADDLQELRDEIGDNTEDEFYGLRIKLEDFITESIQEAKEQVIEHIQSRATVHLEFD